jgi:hypothetical protein
MIHDEGEKMGSSNDGVRPAPPIWAVAEGILDEPFEGESFSSYWARHGYGDEVDRALQINPCVADMANLRMGHEVRMRHLARFDVHVCSRLLAAGGRFHHH